MRFIGIGTLFLLFSSCLGPGLYTGKNRSSRYFSLISGAANLIGYWRFNDAESAIAKSIIGPDGSWSGSRAGTDGAIAYDSDRAVRTHGSGQMIATPNFNLGIGASFTIEVWFRSSIACGGPANLVTLEGGATPHAIISCVGGGATTFNALCSNSIGGPSPSFPNFIDGKWHHLVGTKDGSNDVRFYVDGNTSGPPNNFAYTGNFNFNTNLLINTPDSDFDELAVYSRALNEDEIKEHYRVGIGEDEEHED